MPRTLKYFEPKCYNAFAVTDIEFVRLMHGIETYQCFKAIHLHRSFIQQNRTKNLPTQYIC